MSTQKGNRNKGRRRGVPIRSDGMMEWWSNGVMEWGDRFLVILPRVDPDGLASTPAESVVGRGQVKNPYCAALHTIF